MENAQRDHKEAVKTANPCGPLEFLTFLARIKDGDSDLKHLHAMANNDGNAASYAYHKLSPDLRDQLQIRLRIVDSHGSFIPPFKEISKRCIKTDTDSSTFYLDFSDSKDQNIIKTSGGASTNTAPTPRPMSGRHP